MSFRLPCGARNPAFEAFLVDVRRRVMGAFSNQEVPFDRVVEAINAPRSADRNPVFQVQFLYDEGVSESLQVRVFGRAISVVVCVVACSAIVSGEGGLGGHRN